MSIYVVNLEVHLTNELSRIRNVLVGLDQGVLDEVFAKWSRMYSAFIIKRFIAAARGDGTWRPLAPSTVQARRRKRRGRVLILRDSDLLFENIAPRFEQVYKTQVGKAKFAGIVDPGGNAQYPNGKSVREVMLYHQVGGPNLPQRKIFVPPPKELSSKMAYEAKQIIKRLNKTKKKK